MRLLKYLCSVINSRFRFRRFSDFSKTSMTPLVICSKLTLRSKYDYRPCQDNFICEHEWVKRYTVNW
jgi:hypothetical protein